MRRFLRLWAALACAYALAAPLSAYLLLHFVDLTYEAFAAALLVPVAQALVLAARERSGPLLPSGRPPLLAVAPLLLAAAVAAEALRRPLDPRWGLLAPGTAAALLPRLLALLAGAALLAAAFRLRARRAAPALLAGLLLLLGLDALVPWLGRLPGALLPKPGPFVSGLAVYGALLVLLFVAALAAQRSLEAERAWAARLLGASLAFLFAAVHGASLELFLRPWLTGAFTVLVPAALHLSAALAAGAGLAALARPREDAA